MVGLQQTKLFIDQSGCARPCPASCSPFGWKTPHYTSSYRAECILPGLRFPSIALLFLPSSFTDEGHGPIANVRVRPLTTIGEYDFEGKNIKYAFDFEVGAATNEQDLRLCLLHQNGWTVSSTNFVLMFGKKEGQTGYKAEEHLQPIPAAPYTLYFVRNKYGCPRVDVLPKQALAEFKFRYVKPRISLEKILKEQRRDLNM